MQSANTVQITVESSEMTSEDFLLKQAVIIGMVGGPGSGKGTQCQGLSQTHDIVHISIGDVLRAEMNRKGSQYAEIIRENMMAGKVGPKEITVPILRAYILRNLEQKRQTFVLDGFPRSNDQSDYFEHLICPITCLVVLECPESVVIERLTHSDRDRFDDNLDIIRRRLDTFQNTTSGVIDIFHDRGKVRIVDSNQAPQDVSLQIEAVVEDLGVTKH